MAQFARPDSNVTQTSFTGGFSNIDESTASDADIAWGADNTAAVLEVGLSNVTDPTVSTGHVVRYRIAKTNDGALDGAGNDCTVTAALFQGGTQIAADTARTATGTWTTYTLNLSGGQADAITDYTDLRLRFTTSASGGNPTNRRGAAVSWAELEVPDVSADRSGSAPLQSVANATSATGTKGASGTASTTAASATTADGGETVTPPTDIYGAAVFADGPIAYWRLGEPSGTTAVAVVGPDGTYINTPTLGGTGLVLGSDTAVAFARASEEWVDVPSGMAAGSAAGATIEAWVTFASLADGVEQILAQWGDHFLKATGTSVAGAVSVTWGYNDGAAQQTGTNVEASLVVGEVYHLVFTHDYTGQEVALYINGVEHTSMFQPSTTALAPAADQRAALAGNWINTTRVLDGTLDEVAIYDSVLTPSQVTEHYAAGSSLYAQEVLADSPTAYYRMGEPSGSVIDTMGGPSGTVTGTITRDVAGALATGDDGAISNPSNASVGYVVVPDSDAIGSGTEPWSVEFWFAAGSINTNRTVMRKPNGANQAYAIQLTSSNKMWWAAQGSVIGDSSVTITDSDWHHCVIQKNGSTREMWIDGVECLVPTGNTPPIDNSTEDLWIGAWNIAASDEFWSGSLDEIAFYDTMLTSTRIAAHYAAGAGQRAPIVRYIDPAGDDSTGTGLIGSPWRTLQKLYDALTVPGDEGIVRGGTYTGGDIGDAIVTASGNASDPIYVHAYPGETPIFDGVSSGTFVHPLWFDGASYHVVEGLSFKRFAVDNAATIFFGGNGNLTDHITVKRCRIEHLAGQTSNEHGFYLSSSTDSITIGGAEGDGNVVVGAGVTTEGAGIEAFHTPGSTNFDISWNAIDGMTTGIQIWDDDATGEITHNTVLNCYNQYDLRFHSTLLLRDNVGGPVVNLGIYDPNDSASTTSDHNYTGETLTAAPDYGLTAGSSAIGGASDGGDAGWVAYSSVQGTAAVSATSAATATGQKAGASSASASATASGTASGAKGASGAATAVSGASGTTASGATQRAGAAAAVSATSDATAAGTAVEAHSGSAQTTAVSGTTATGIAGRRGAAIATATATPTGTATTARSGTASASGATDTSASGNVLENRSGAADAVTAASGTSASGRKDADGAATMAASAQITLSILAGRLGSASLAASGATDATGRTDRSGTTALPLTATAAATGTSAEAHSGTAATSASAGTSAAGSPARMGSASATGVATPTATVGTQRSGAAAGISLTSDATATGVVAEARSGAAATSAASGASATGTKGSAASVALSAVQAASAGATRGAVVTIDASLVASVVAAAMTGRLGSAIASLATTATAAGRGSTRTRGTANARARGTTGDRPRTTAIPRTR